MLNASSFNLTGGEKNVVEQLADLDQQLWKGLEDQLWLRSPYKGRFDLHCFERQPQPWEWMILRCQTWEEVERVLNWHKVEWHRDGYRKILTQNKMLIFRCA
jgi:hypothetical protein